MRLATVTCCLNRSIPPSVFLSHRLCNPSAAQCYASETSTRPLNKASNLLFGIPNFDALTGDINTHQIAQWLHRCLEEKLSIVRFPASPFEEKSQTWEALVKSHHPSPSVLIPKSPLGVGDILDELAWHKQKHPRPTICVTPHLNKVHLQT